MTEGGGQKLDVIIYYFKSKALLEKYKVPDVDTEY